MWEKEVLFFSKGTGKKALQFKGSPGGGPGGEEKCDQERDRLYIGGVTTCGGKRGEGVLQDRGGSDTYFQRKKGEIAKGREEKGENLRG